MAGDEGHIVAAHLVGDGDRLLRIAGIVADIEIELLAEHATRGVDVLDGHLAAVLHLRPERGVLTRDRADDGDRRRLVVIATAAARHKNGRNQGCDQPGKTLHCYLPRKRPVRVYIIWRGPGAPASLYAPRSRQVSGLVRS